MARVLTAPGSGQVALGQRQLDAVGDAAARWLLAVSRPRLRLRLRTRNRPVQDSPGRRDDDCGGVAPRGQSVDDEGMPLDRARRPDEGDLGAGRRVAYRLTAEPGDPQDVALDDR